MFKTITLAFTRSSVKALKPNAKFAVPVEHWPAQWGNTVTYIATLRQLESAGWKTQGPPRFDPVPADYARWVQDFEILH